MTSTEPCIVVNMSGTFKSEMIFPITPKYCIRFKGKKQEKNRHGKYYEISNNDVKKINNLIISKSKNIVISESKIITDRI